MSRIDLDLTPALLQRVRVKAAYLQLTPQAYLVQAIEQDVADVNIPAKYAVTNGKNGATRGNGNGAIAELVS